MPIQTFNFANIEPMKLGSRFSDILAGFKTSEDSEDRRIKNEGLGYQNAYTKALAESAPEHFKYANEQARQQNIYYPRTQEELIRQHQLINRQLGVGVGIAEDNDIIRKQVFQEILQSMGIGNQQPDMPNNPGLQFSNQQSYANPQVPGQPQTPQQFAQALQSQSPANPQAPEQPQVPGQPQGPEQLAQAMQAPSIPNEKIINQGNPALDKFDKLWENPLAQPYLKKLFPNAGTKNEFNEKTGQHISATTWPSGKVTRSAQQVGKTKYDQVRDEKMAEANVKAYEENNKKLEESGNTGDAIEELNNLILKHPNIEEIVGPFNSKTPDTLRSEKNQDLVGKVKSTLGKIVLDTAKEIKGAWNARDQAMVDEYKPSMSDDYDVFIGKVKAMTLLHRVFTQRRQLYAEHLHNDVSPHQAAKMAQEQTDIDKLRPQLEKLGGTHLFTDKKTGEVYEIGKLDEKNLAIARKDKNLVEDK